ncbi:MAG: hypothetical protein KAI51_01485 [Candidatus Aenigmarchaeota archaeon]|nr:hypothetical protein [Candidatus Aenigmarchaeota archaeon]
MRPEILKLKTEMAHEQAEIAKHHEKMVGVRKKVVKLFKEDKNIAFDDFKKAGVLMDSAYGFEYAALERMDMPNIKDFITENMVRRLIKVPNVEFIAIDRYFNYMGESCGNTMFFKSELDEILEYYLKDVTDFIKNHIGADSKKYFKEL